MEVFDPVGDLREGFLETCCPSRDLKDEYEQPRKEREGRGFKAETPALRRERARQMGRGKEGLYGHSRAEGVKPRVV